jgi:hypothetical protein
MAHDDALRAPWRALPRDLIGGWCVKPVTVVAWDQGGSVADFINETLARHIADLHNAWLDDQSDTEWADYKRRNPEPPKRITPRPYDELRGGA